jgi:hypothetical protein
MRALKGLRHLANIRWVALSFYRPPTLLRSRHYARAASPRRRSPNANSLCGQNPAGPWKSMRPFKGIICDDISEFESYMPSQAVRSLCVRRG